MTDGRWILDGLLGTAMRRMPGMSSVGFQPATDLASAEMTSTRDASDNAPTRRAEQRPETAYPSFDPKLRATTEMILSMPVDDRLRQLEAESKLFASIRPLDD
jgi:hypothetical protein